ncbi:hypothetical protein BJV82DRAFT_675218 [Fennellomyces sp. T-0311]|nr:hypothetical protein BJV82DRAFT_675218 [Fennellomyces sp. T-0311]
MTSRHNDSSNSENEFLRQIEFIATLPSDVVLEIFAYVDQQDCLTSITVCRDWYPAIPEPSTPQTMPGKPRKNVTVKPDREASGGDRLSEQELHALMQKLFDWELIHCATTHLDECLDLMKLLASHLASLILENHACNVDILLILYAFPDLTHFSRDDYNFPNDDRTLIIRPQDIPINYYSKITHLHLNVALTKVQKNSVLKRCPDLRSFIDTDRQLTLVQNVTVGLDELFSWCPKISFLETTRITINEHTDRYKDGQGGLHFFSTSENYGVDLIDRQHKINQDMLEHLFIR